MCSNTVDILKFNTITSRNETNYYSYLDSSHPLLWLVA